MQDTHYPGHQDQQATLLLVHVDCAVQGVTDGQKTVIGHHSEDVVVQYCKEEEKMHLADAACICYNFALRLDAQQHLGDGGGGEAHVHKGQVGEEEVHECVQVGV